MLTPGALRFCFDVELGAPAGVRVSLALRHRARRGRHLLIGAPSLVTKAVDVLATMIAAKSISPATRRPDH